MFEFEIWLTLDWVLDLRFGFDFGLRFVTSTYFGIRFEDLKFWFEFSPRVGSVFGLGMVRGFSFGLGLD